MSQRELIVVVKDDPFSDQPPRLIKAKAGTPIAELVDMTGFDQLEVEHTEASINGEVIDAELWAETPGKGHVQLVVLPQGGGDDGNKLLRTVLSLAVIVGAFYLGPQVAGIFAASGTKAFAAISAITTGVVSTVGQLIVNAIVPPPRFDAGDPPDPVYFIEGARNRLSPLQPIKTVLGRHRLVPGLGARPYPEIRGDDTYYYMIVELGPLGIEVSDRKVGDTPLSEFDEVVYQSRLTETDPHPTMASRQVISDAVGATLLESDPESRRTASDAIDCDLILTFPQGLGRSDSKGNPQSHTVTIQVRYRLVTDPGGPGETLGPWRFASEPQNVTYPPFRGFTGGVFDALAGAPIDSSPTYGTSGTFSFKEAKPAQPLFKQIGFSFPIAGTYDVEVLRTSADSTDSRTFDDITWQTMLSKRDERAILRDDVAYEVYRFKGTDETSGAIDELNMVVGRKIPTFPDAVLDQPDLSGVTETDLNVVKVSSNPWEIALWTMRNGFDGRLAVSDANFDWPSFAAAVKDARDRGLKFDYVVQNDINNDELGNMIASIGGEGRIYSFNNTWTVGLDRPIVAPTHVFRDGTARSISSDTTFPEDVHAYRVRFNDAQNGYRLREVIIYVDGYTVNTATRFEDITLPGKTDWDDLHRAVAQIWRNSRLQRKSVTLEVPKASVDNSLRPMSRVSVASRVIAKTMISGTVRSVTNNAGTVTHVELDQEVEYGPSFPGLGLKWVGKDLDGNPVISSASALLEPVSDGVYSTVEYVTGVPAVSAPQAGDEFIIGPLTDDLYEGLLADVEDAGEDWLRLELRSYAPARFDETGLSIPAYALAPVLPYGARPPAPILNSIQASNVSVVIALAWPEAYVQQLIEVRVWRAYEVPTTDPNPGLLSEFEPLPPMSPEQRKFVDGPGIVGQRVVYRFQGIGTDGRAGKILVTPATDVLDALPDLVGLLATPGVETGADGESKPIIQVLWAAEDDRSIANIAVQVRQVAKDGGGVRLPEGSQPSYETYINVSAADGSAILRSLAGGQDYDVRAYFIGRRGEIGQVHEVTDVTLAAATAGGLGPLAISDLSEDEVRNALLVVSAASLLPNWDFTHADADGKPAGIEPIQDVTTREPIQFMSPAEVSAAGFSGRGLKHQSASDDLTGIGFPAIYINDREFYVVTIRHRSSAATGSGLFLRFCELDGALDSGKTHIGFAPFGDKTMEATSLVDVVANGPMPGTATVTESYLYSPTPGTRFASFTLYNWSGAGLTAHEVDFVSLTSYGDYTRGADRTIDNTAAAILDQDWGATASEDEASNAVLPFGQNRVFFPRGENGTEGWDVFNPWGLSHSIAQVASGGRVGQRATITATGASQTFALRAGAQSPYHIPVVPNERLCVALDLEASSVSAGNVIIYFYDEAGSFVSFGVITSFSSDQAFVQPVFNFVDVPANAVRAQLDVGITTSGAGTVLISAVDLLVAAVPNIQTARPVWVPGPVHVPRADVTGEESAASIIDQGGLATGNYYQQNSEPAGAPDGSLWADTDDNQLKLKIVGSWQVIADISGASMTASLSPSSISGYAPGVGYLETGNCTVGVSGGNSPITYFYEIYPGTGAAPNLIGQSTNTVRVGATLGANDLIDGQIRVTVSDANGRTAVRWIDYGLSTGTP